MIHTRSFVENTKKLAAMMRKSILVGSCVGVLAATSLMLTRQKPPPENNTKKARRNRRPRKDGDLVQSHSILGHIFQRKMKPFDVYAKDEKKALIRRLGTLLKAETTLMQSPSMKNAQAVQEQVHRCKHALAYMLIKLEDAENKQCVEDFQAVHDETNDFIEKVYTNSMILMRELQL